MTQSNIDQHYLELLAKSYPNRVAAFSEIINLQAILNLPKGTEHFVSDLHGEYEAFCHILNSCSGVIHDKVREIFPSLDVESGSELCALIYYPEQVLDLTEKQGRLSMDWCKERLNQLIILCRSLSAKYTRSKVRKAINQNYSYIIDELLHAQRDDDDKDDGYSRSEYHAQIVETIMRTHAEKHFITSLCALCKRLAVDHLHVVGDIYDRGPFPDKIMNLIMNYHSIDIQWGNHDVLWMGAALGSEICMATVLRNNINYFNCSVLESTYGISLRKLNDFAQKTYNYPVKERSKDPKNQVAKTALASGSSIGSDTGAVGTGAAGAGVVACTGAACAISGSTAAELAHEGTMVFLGEEAISHDHEYELIMQAYADENRSKMVKAITVIALKLQGQLIKRNPDFQMDDRLLMDKMDLKRGIVTIDGKEYELNTVDLPTIDPADPYALSVGETYVVESLKKAFAQSKELQTEVAFLFSHGSIYKRFNGNLLYHGCVPLTGEGKLRTIVMEGKELKGRAYMDYCEKKARHAYSHRDQPSLDFLYFLWCGFNSPLSGRIMKPFERYFVDDHSTHKEPRDPYYDQYFSEDVCRMILREFDLNDDTGHIINGHTPIRVKEGESPIRGNGKLYVIDGGLCRAYHKTTGIAGYTLISSSHCMVLKAHHAFDSIDRAIHDHVDLESESREVEHYSKRVRIEDADNGVKIKHSISDLEDLLRAYQNGIIPEHQTTTTTKRI